MLKTRTVYFQNNEKSTFLTEYKDENTAGLIKIVHIFRQKTITIKL
jgi:hypothetical protein